MREKYSGYVGQGTMGPRWVYMTEKSVLNKQQLIYRIITKELRSYCTVTMEIAQILLLKFEK